MNTPAPAATPVGRILRRWWVATWPPDLRGVPTFAVDMAALSHINRRSNPAR